MKRRIVILILLISSFLAALPAGDEAAEAGPLKGKTIVLILPERYFHETEYEWLKEIFLDEGASVVTASAKLAGVYSASGKEVKPDIRLKDMVVDEIDAIVFIGGAGSLQYVSDYTAHKIAKQALRSEKILAAIDQAPRILAQAGLLRGKKVTCTSPAKSYLTKQGAVFTGKDVQWDKNLVTATGPNAITQLGKEMVSVLYRRTYEEK